MAAVEKAGLAEKMSHISTGAPRRPRPRPADARTTRAASPFTHPANPILWETNRVCH